MLDGKPRFIGSLGTESLTEANRLKLPLVAEWKPQINRLERGKSDKIAGLERGFPAWNMALDTDRNKCADEDGRQVNCWMTLRSNGREGSANNP